MAIYHMSIKIGSKSKGQSAVAAAAYRSGEKLTDKETGLTSDYTKKGGVVFSEISLCDNAPAEYADRATLWNAVHQIEKNKNAQLWREFEVALPQELSREEQIATIRDFVKQLTARGMCADWSLHDKGDGNPHAHIMATMRSITEDGKWVAKSRLVYDLDEHGERIFQKVNKQGRKQYKSHKEDYNDWNAAERVEEWRAAWAECCNARLAERDHIDHRSYERQGIDQIPTIHEGYAARQIAAKGEVSERVELNNEIRQKNMLLKGLLKQLKTIGEEIKQFAQEKGSALSGRVADLIARRNRAVGESERGTTDGERAAENRVKKAAPDETDRLIRQAKAERRTASDFIRNEENGNQDRGIAAGSERNSEDSAAIIRAADAAIKDTGTNLEQSRITVTNSSADRANRAAERERLAAEERRSQREAADRERERAEKARKSHGISR